MDSVYKENYSGETLMERKKVLQFIHGFSMGGAEKLVSEYCLKLNKELEVDKIMNQWIQFIKKITSEC